MFVQVFIFMVPTWTGKPAEMGKYFPVREFWTDCKNLEILLKILEKWGTVTPSDTEPMAKIAVKMSIMRVGKFMSSPGNDFTS